MAKFFISKYVLSGAGIFEIESARSEYDTIRDTRPGNFGSNCFHYGKDAFDTRAAALADAESRRERKIASLKKQITKIEGLQLT